jgi:benzoyl-CoA reductase/2-hydroxyglutaryl-CoA dehydratase subunit BcrC/BadD/HgdB
MEFLAFDLKKIELELKNSSNPRIKIQKDKKLIQDIKKRYIKLLDENKFDFLTTDIEKTQPLFVLADSEGYKFFEVLSRSFSSFIQKINHKENLLKQESETKLSLKNLRDNIKQSSSEVPKYQKEIQLQREKHGVYNLTKRKEALLNHSDISLFFKILTTALERYIKMIERREKQRLEGRDLLLGLIIEPTKFNGLNEALWKQIVFIIETHGIELLNGKNWFKFDFSDDLREFITREDILKKYSELRDLEKELEKIDSELNQNSSFSKAYNFIKENESLKLQLEESEKSLPDINEEIDELSLRIEDERLKILHSFNYTFCRISVNTSAAVAFFTLD